MTGAKHNAGLVTVGANQAQPLYGRHYVYDDTGTLRATCYDKPFADELELRWNAHEPGGRVAKLVEAAKAVQCRTCAWVPQRDCNGRCVWCVLRAALAAFQDGKSK